MEQKYHFWCSRGCRKDVPEGFVVFLEVEADGSQVVELVGCDDADGVFLLGGDGVDEGLFSLAPWQGFVGFGALQDDVDDIVGVGLG